MKVNVSRSRKSRRPFDKSHDVNTTSDWGFIQPTLCDEIIGGSTINFKANTFCRLSPLVAPTFGRATVKHYGYYVPLRDVYMPFENLMGGETYNGGENNYIPTSVPVVSLRELTIMLLENQHVYAYKYTKSNNYVNITGSTPVSSMWASFARRYSDKIPTRFVEDSSVTIDNADFIIDIQDSTNYLLCFKFDRNAKHLRKVFIGLGIPLNFDSDVRDISLLPIFAYYKAWFDLFAVKRTINWQSTQCYQIIQEIARRNVVNIYDDSSLKSKLKNFFDEIKRSCYYTCDPDYFTVHQDNMYNAMTSARFSVPVMGSSVTPTTMNVQATPDRVNIINLSPGVESPIAQRFANLLLKWANKNTVIGQRLAAYFAAHGLGDVDDNKDTHFIGASSVNVDFSDVMNTTDTKSIGGAPLGEYAGKGTAVGSSDTFNFTPSSTGYFIVLMCVVPRCGYVQGCSPYLHHTSRFKFFNDDFEAMFMQVTSRKDMIGACDVCLDDVDRQEDFDAGFGFIPSYSEYKQKQNVANGDISLRSTRTTMLPYILDRWFTMADFESTGTVNRYRLNSVSPFVVNDALREIGSSELFGNFDRIFELYDPLVLPTEDPFLLHNMYEYRVIQPMLPMKDSFDTDSQDGDNMSIEHA